jgi:hypothetical protein
MLNREMGRLEALRGQLFTTHRGGANIALQPDNVRTGAKRTSAGDRFWPVAVSQQGASVSRGRRPLIDFTQ